MSIATPSPANDAALNAQLDVTRDASLANLRQKSEDVQSQFREEAAKIADQKQRSAEVVQTSVNAALDNAALRSEAEYNQAFKNLQTAEELAMRTSVANPRESRLPLELHRQVVESTQKFLSAQADYVRTHPDKASDPAYNIQLAEDGNGGFQLVNGLDPGLAEQVTITSPDEARTMPLEELRRNIQRPKERQADPNEPLVKFVDQPDGTFDTQLITGETFRGFKATENREAIRKIAESKVNTRRHYENLMQQQQPGQPTNGQQPQQQPTNGQHTEPGLTANQPFDSQAYLREETAKALGFTNADEMITDYRFMREQAEKYRILELSSSFHSRNQDFPNADQAVEALEQVCRANNWDMENIDNLSNAHAVAVRHGLYQPLSQDQIRASYAGPEPAHRPTPPPMIRSSNPDMARPTEDPHTMPLDQLRRLALAEGRAVGGR
jgi:hypothetical protein